MDLREKSVTACKNIYVVVKKKYLVTSGQIALSSMSRSKGTEEKIE